MLRMTPRDPGKSSWLEERVIRDLRPRMGIIRGRRGSNRAREEAGDAVRSGPKKWLRSRCDCRGNGFMEKDERLFIRFTGREMPRPLWGPPNGTHSVGSCYTGRAFRGTKDADLWFVLALKSTFSHDISKHTPKKNIILEFVLFEGTFTHCC